MDIRNQASPATKASKKAYVAPVVTDLGDAVSMTLGAVTGEALEPNSISGGFISWS